MIMIIDLYLLLQQPLGVFDICFFYTLFVWLWVLDDIVQFITTLKENTPFTLVVLNILCTIFPWDFIMITCTIQIVSMYFNRTV